jgi:ribosomal protein S8
MKTFKQFVNEGSYPLWTKAVTAGLVLKVRNLSMQIDREVDVSKQNVMIGQQNKLLAYLNGLGIAVGTNDQQLMTSVRSKAS